MRNIHALCLWFVAATLLLASCKKDDNNGNTPGQPTCKVTKAYTYNSSTGAIADSVSYTYTGNNITKLQGSRAYLTLDYSSDNKVSKRNYFLSNSTTPDEYMQMTYNPDGSLSKVENFEKTSTGYSSYYRYDIAYTSGKINKITAYGITNGAATVDEEFTYTYTGNNITGVTDKYTDSTGQVQNDVLTYTYDNTTNNFQKQSTQYHLIDPLFGDFNPIFLPAFLSANNLTQIGAGGQNYPFGSSLDAKQNLANVSLFGKQLISYVYQCQ